jgi:VIT1/CCC1 family predicted Fe2+/Mn2+ transporter
MPTRLRFLADFTLGFADGLTVPFALTAGLSSLGRTDTVVYAGVAEICAGSISMGIGGYLSAKGAGAASETRNPDEGRSDGDCDLDDVEVHTEDAEKANTSSAVTSDVMDYLQPLELPDGLFRMVVEHVQCHRHILESLTAEAEREKDNETPQCSPVLVGLSVSLGYLLGGILPLFPYFLVDRVGDGVFWSFAICLLALFSFGFGKDFVLRRQRRKEENAKRVLFAGRRGLQRADINQSLWEGLQMVLLGGVAALAAVICVRSFEGLRVEASSDVSA